MEADKGTTGQGTAGQGTTRQETTGQETTGQETTGEETTGTKRITAGEHSIRREYGFAPDVELKECRYCRVMIPKKARICPNCRMSLKRRWLRHLAAVVFAAAVIVVGGCYLSENWDILKDAAASVWAARNSSAVPAASAAVDNTQPAADVVTAKPSAVTAGAAGTGQSAGSMEEGAGTINDTEADEAAAVPNGEEKAADFGAGRPTEAADSVEDRTDTVKAGTAGTAEKAEQAREASSDMPADVPEEAQSTEAEAADTGTEDEKNRSHAASSKDMDEKEKNFREECAVVSYKALLRDTEAYMDTQLMVEARVVCQVDGGLFDENIYYLCMAEEKNDIKCYYIVRDDREADDTLILEGDKLAVFGHPFGSCKLPDGLIEKNPAVPAVSMLYYDLLEE